MSDQHHPEELNVLQAGVLTYVEALAWQQRLHAQVVATAADNYVLCVEHPAVLTLGKHADLAHLSFGEAHYRGQGVEVVRTDRGGEVTAHMPGQLVVYPIIRLSSYRLSPKSYVSILESAVIQVLASCGLAADRDSEHPGVWVGQDKICAIGIRIKDRVTMHGIALNVTNDLSLFAQIVPCGISGRGVTSMARLCQGPVDMAQVSRAFTRQLGLMLSKHAGATRRFAPLQWQEGLSTI